MAEEVLLVCGGEQAFHSRLDFFDTFIDDAVGPDVDTLSFC